MWHGRAPAIGEALEVGQRKGIQVLARNAHDTELAQCIQQQRDLLRIEPLPQVDAVQAPPRAADGQRSLATRLRAEQPAQLPVEVRL